jgi:hypothetical protein
MGSGKTFGCRMASQTRAESSRPGLRALAFQAFRCARQKHSSTEPAEHLARVGIPRRFLSSTLATQAA